LAGIWLVAQNGERGASLAGLPQALLAGLGFGLFFILIARSSDPSTTFWPLAVARVVPAPFTLGVLLLRRQLQPFPRAVLPIALLSGVLDVAGNTFFLLASQVGQLDIAAVLSSLYPASTVLLARGVLGERTTRLQLLGLLAVLGAIVLIVLEEG
ncbi:MAG: EamA family transporter, partial [Roseiflexaceae bacterium]|nr:EamA family transporter [Roseiflexaceae bacterium]